MRGINNAFSPNLGKHHLHIRRLAAQAARLCIRDGHIDRLTGYVTGPALRAKIVLVVQSLQSRYSALQADEARERPRFIVLPITKDERKK